MIYVILIMLTALTLNMILYFHIMTLKQSIINRKRTVFFVFGLVFVFSIVAQFVLKDNTMFGFFPGLYYLPLLCYVFAGHIFQKIFICITMLVITFSFVGTVMVFGLNFYSYGSDSYMQMVWILFAILMLMYFYASMKWGKVITDKIFSSTSTRIWGFYLILPTVSYFVLRQLIFTRKIETDPILSMTIIGFILANLTILVSTIINTGKISTQKYELEFTKNIISTGQDHYKKLHEQRELVNILQHDYKHQLNAIQGLLESGEKGEAESLLTQFRQQFEEEQLPLFCENAVVNAQITEFYIRCKNYNISFKENIHLPSDTGINNYELCILLGNLLENAWDACTHPDFTGEKWITLNIKLTSTQIAVRVQNSFDGIVEQQGEALASRKNNEGLGIKSVRAVAARYRGEYMPDWDKNIFTAYVLLNLNE